MTQARNANRSCVIIMQKIVNGRRIQLYSVIYLIDNYAIQKVHKY